VKSDTFDNDVKGVVDTLRRIDEERREHDGA